MCRRIRLGAVPWVLALLCVAACNTPEPASSQVDVQTITWYTSPVSGKDPMAILVEAFERTHPAIRVHTVALSDSTDVERMMIREAIENGINPPDVYLGDVIWPAEFSADHLALPLDGVFGEEVWKRFPPELVSAATYGGTKYTVPFHSDQGLLYYRADLMKPEEVPRTWEDLAVVARQLQEREGFEDGLVWQGAEYEGLTCNWLEMVSAAGGQVLDDEGAKSRMTSPASTRALQFMRRLIKEKVTPPDVTGFAEPAKRFASGRVPFMRGWNSAYPDIKERLGQQAGDKVGVAPLPTFSGQPYPGPSTVGGWSLYVNPNTEKLDAVKEFVDWLTDAPAQRIVARYSLIPTNRNVRSDWNVMGASPTLRVVLAGATSAGGPKLVTRPSNTSVYPEVSKAVYVNIHRALTGEATPEQALADADREINKTLEPLPAQSRPTAPPTVD
jgi:multiple sugar transport system substrate-binding protein